MKSLIKNNLQLAKRFNCTMRYIDDLLTLNNTKFACAIPDIYPPELDLKKTTECPTTLSYLDLLIIIDNGKYSTTVYDKRDDFNFCVVNFPHLSSNISTKPACSLPLGTVVVCLPGKQEVVSSSPIGGAEFSIFFSFLCNSFTLF